MSSLTRSRRRRRIKQRISADFGTDSDSNLNSDGSEEMFKPNAEFDPNMYSTKYVAKKQEMDRDIITQPIFLDLNTLCVMKECSKGNELDKENEVKLLMQKFLETPVLVRKLYDPEDSSDDEEQVEESHFGDLTIDLQTDEVGAAINSSSILNLPNKPTNQELETKMFFDMARDFNAAQFKLHALSYLKEPIDMSEVRNVSCCSETCRKHKMNKSTFLEHPCIYSFVDSLRKETPLNLCQPQALVYRNGTFSKVRRSLADWLFVYFNHQIFKCQLKPVLEWTSGIKTASCCAHSIRPDGKRVTTIYLSISQIREPTQLVKVLIHEMCHAAAFAYHSELGHGVNCRKWCYQAKVIMPELLEIVDCAPELKYMCGLCKRSSYGFKFSHLGSEVQLRCDFCHFEITTLLLTDDIIRNFHISRKPPTDYEVFVRENYARTLKTLHLQKIQELNDLYCERIAIQNSNRINS